ncbi:phage tail tip fiber protein [Janthinobacterium sp. 1_2014MBL_MicDiv]|uniref:phage tail tip fiber protein n=1 Tax=Janthinobacterium sp. 1_2014MBL_MicDiv TaxID=1644131 RepID=UPI0008F4BECD|nr:DUF1983 domain-containing protein [Janthinobacterium sp. 1_2014MBL_MicDiv]APA67998.1 hypothetical protein YQ44_09285 [Janthinobacterium sp. 1_2014MBL_MicDiv]
MAAPINDRDLLLQATSPRYAPSHDAGVLLSASSSLFEVTQGGSAAPAEIVLTATILGASGSVLFSTAPETPLRVSGNSATLRYADMVASTVTVSATAVIDGRSHVGRQTIAMSRPLDLTPPPAPSGLFTTGKAATIELGWAPPPANYHQLAYTEVWRAPVNNFAQATLLARADGRSHVDPVGPGATRYYWIRYVSWANVPGPYNASSGTVGASDIEVEHLLGVLTAQLTESQLSNHLGDRIALVDGPATLAGSVTQRLAAESQARTAAIQIEATTRATQTGQLSAQYTIKQDVNGYISGYGLATTANNATPTSLFAVRADTFMIANPSGPGIPASMPFIVRATETVVNGVTVPIGVYIADAYIQNASVTNAKIGGDIWSSNYVAGQAGWYLQRGGDLYANNVRLRGSIAGGTFTSSAWPAAGSGFYLGPEGLRLGNKNTGGYFRLDSDGDISSPQFQVAAGNATFSGALKAASGSLGTITSGRLQNATNTAYVNLDASGDQMFISIGDQIGLRANGSGYFSRDIVSAPKVVKNGTLAIDVGWVGNISGNLVPFTVYIDTGHDFAVGWHTTAGDTFLANATISFGGSSSGGGCNGFGESTVVVGDGLATATGLYPIDNRIYIRYTWTPVQGSGRIYPATLDWKLVKV